MSEYQINMRFDLIEDKRPLEMVNQVSSFEFIFKRPVDVLDLRFIEKRIRCMLESYDFVYHTHMKI